MKMTNVLVAGVVALFLVAAVSAKEATKAAKAPKVAKKVMVCMEKDPATGTATQKEVAKPATVKVMDEKECTTLGGLWVEKAPAAPAAAPAKEPVKEPAKEQKK
jgi:hypothetical protein